MKIFLFALLTIVRITKSTSLGHLRIKFYSNNIKRSYKRDIAKEHRT